MGVCTSKANRRIPRKSGSNGHLDVPKSIQINTCRRHNQYRYESNRQSKSRISTSRNETTNDDHVDNIILDQQRNPPDDTNFIFLSAHDDDNHDNNDLDEDIFSFGYGKSLTSNTFSMLTSPTRQRTCSNDINMVDDPIEMIANDEIIYEIPEFKKDIGITIGDEIELIATYNCLHATIRFVGEIPTYNGIFYGIQLHKPKDSDDVIHWRNLCNRHNGFAMTQNNGYINDKCYFNTYGNDGLFITQEQIGRVLKVNYDMPRVSINDEICNGIVRYMGKPQLKNDENIHDTYYGIELNQINQSIHENNHATHELFHNQCYFSACNKGYGIFLDSSELGCFVKASRFNLLIHGYFHSKINIAQGIIKLIQCYCNIIDIKCIFQSDSIMNNNICKKLEPFDINHNICGPAITIISNKTNTHCKHCEVKICGHYQFIKDCFLDYGDYTQQFVKKTELQIFKLENGSNDKIFRSIETNNENPLLMDHKSINIQMRWRHDIYRDNIDKCNHTKVFHHIADLYGLLPHEMEKQLKRYGITLYGLNMPMCDKNNP